MQSDKSKSQESNLEHFHSALRSEAEISWQRNNYFLVVVSILLLALSQFHQQAIQELVVVFGIVVSAAWIIAHDRSASYLGYWKQEIGTLETNLGHLLVYPKKDVQGVEMRKALYIVPIAFLFLWILLLFLVPLGLLQS